MRRPASRWRGAGPAIPAHVRFLLGHAAIGIAAGWVLAAAVLALNIAHLRSMMLGGPDGLVALGLLLFATAVTFGSAAMGAAIMGLGRATPPQAGPPSGPPVLCAAAVRIARTRRPR